MPTESLHICACSVSFLIRVRVHVWMIEPHGMLRDLQIARMSRANPSLNSVSISPVFISRSEYINFSASPDWFPKFSGCGSNPCPCSKIAFLVASSTLFRASIGISMLSVDTDPSSSLSIFIALYFFKSERNSFRSCPPYPDSTKISSCISSRSLIKPL